MRGRLLAAAHPAGRAAFEVSRVGDADSPVGGVQLGGGPVIQGLRTVIYKVPDLEKAKAWYTRVLGIDPYFAEPFYVGYQVGGFELGLDPDMGGAQPSAGVVAYWAVADAAAAHRRLLELGAAPHEDVRDVGEGIRVCAVRDPFGNVLGIIENPRFSLANVR
ncbi:MAG: VOC family protein [Thermoanaerobaculia bacterium]